VDYVSAAGGTPPEMLRLGNPSKVVTTKATFRFERIPGELRLDSIHPPWTLDDIRANTGFDLGVSGPAVVTPAPTPEELRVLREVVRPLMISTGTYADWARRALADEGA